MAATSWSLGELCDGEGEDRRVCARLRALPRRKSCWLGLMESWLWSGRAAVSRGETRVGAALLDGSPCARLDGGVGGLGGNRRERDSEGEGEAARRSGIEQRAACELQVTQKEQGRRKKERRKKKKKEIKKKKEKKEREEKEEKKKKLDFFFFH